MALLVDEAGVGATLGAGGEADGLTGEHLRGQGGNELRTWSFFSSLGGCRAGSTNGRRQRQGAVRTTSHFYTGSQPDFTDVSVQTFYVTVLSRMLTWHVLVDNVRIVCDVASVRKVTTGRWHESRLD